MKMKDKTYTIIVTASIPVVLAGALAFAAIIPTGNGSTARKLQGAIGWEIMRIDGNRNGRSVEFTHGHIRVNGQKRDGCAMPSPESAGVMKFMFECIGYAKEILNIRPEGQARLYRNMGLLQGVMAVIAREKA